MRVVDLERSRGVESPEIVKQARHPAGASENVGPDASATRSSESFVTNNSGGSESLIPARATFSPCRRWRYALSRDVPDPILSSCLEEPGGTLTFVGLNPSTADETTDDPTIRRCVRFARDWGFDRLKMVNLFAYRATDPTDLFNAARDGADVVGPENDHNLSLAFGGSDRIIAAWGAPVPLTIQRVEQFAETFGGWQFWALGLTALGSPRHPLYMRADVQPFIYDLGARRAA